jgi:hypothetical protein
MRLVFLFLFVPFFACTSALDSVKPSIVFEVCYVFRNDFTLFEYSSGFNYSELDSVVYCSDYVSHVNVYVNTSISYYIYCSDPERPFELFYVDSLANKIFIDEFYSFDDAFYSCIDLIVD